MSLVRVAPAMVRRLPMRWPDSTPVPTTGLESPARALDRASAIVATRLRPTVRRSAHPRWPGRWQLAPLLLAATAACQSATPAPATAPAPTDDPLVERVVVPLVTSTPDTAFPVPYHALAFDPDDADTLWFSLGPVLLVSTTGGTAWEPQVTTATGGSMLYFVEYPPGGQLFQGGKGVFRRSADRGATWEPVARLGDARLKGLTALPASPTTMLALIDGRGLFRSEDGGATWVLVGSDLPGRAFGLWPLRAQPLRLASVDLDGMVPLASEDEGHSWTPLNAVGLEGSLQTIDLAGDGTAYAVTTDGLFVSDDAGATWAKRGLERELVAVAVSPSDPQVVMVVDGNGQVYRSPDGGRTW